MTEKTANEAPQPVAAPAKAARPCWDCQAETAAAHFCPACGNIQPTPPGTDYFSFFALPRKLTLDVAALERQFEQLSWKLHPDNFHRASSYEQELSLDKTATLNDAFRTLRDAVARVEYLLGLEGVRREGEIKQQAPPDLLAEVFELNEYLEELREARRSGPAPRGVMEELKHRLEKARAAFQEKMDAVLAELDAEFAAFDSAADSAPRRSALQKMSEILNRHSYIRNLVRNVTEELEET
jgi:molecular chaperone HscB